MHTSTTGIQTYHPIAINAMVVGFLASVTFFAICSRPITFQVVPYAFWTRFTRRWCLQGNRVGSAGMSKTLELLHLKNTSAANREYVQQKDEKYVTPESVGKPLSQQWVHLLGR